MVVIVALMIVQTYLLARIASNQVSMGRVNLNNTKAVMESIAYWGKKIVDARSN